MLTSLLPGVRQLRTPMAAGAVIALTIILAVGIGRLDANRTTGLVRDMATLVRVVGRPVALAGLGFAVYVLGVLWQSALRFGVRALYERVGLRAVREVHRATSRAVFAGVSRRVLDQIVEVTTTRLQRELAAGASRTAVADYQAARFKLTDGSDAADDALVRSAAKVLTPAAARELLELVPTRLIAAEKELWAGWDQARAEAEFRTTLAVPLAVLAATLALTYHPLWWVGVLIAPLLLRIGSESGQRATEVLLEAVRAGKTVLFEDGALPAVQWSTVVVSNVNRHGVVAAAT